MDQQQRDAEKRIEALLFELVTLQKTYIERKTDTRISSLSPRRQELVRMIRDQKQVSFDYIVRNFRGVRPGTLHYDLAQLVKKGYIRKLGSTRGVLYASVQV